MNWIGLQFIMVDVMNVQKPLTVLAHLRKYLFSRNTENHH